MPNEAYGPPTTPRGLVLRVQRLLNDRGWICGRHTGKTSKAALESYILAEEPDSKEAAKLRDAAAKRIAEAEPLRNKFYKPGMPRTKENLLAFPFEGRAGAPYLTTYQ